MVSRVRINRNVRKFEEIKLWDIWLVNKIHIFLILILIGITIFDAMNSKMKKIHERKLGKVYSV